MPFEKTEIDGLQIFTPKIYEDARGFFYESFTAQGLSLAFAPFVVAQVNNSLSGKGVIRGIHFTKPPPGQSKFVSVFAGSIFDVAIDLRKSSRTFGNWQGFLLSAENNQSLLIGNGIGHAFLALENETRISYLCDSGYEPSKEFGIHPMTAGIAWEENARKFGITEFSLSEKDQIAPDFADAAELWFL
jgi:dTDP-4-dehydrorhamnose 3,5-epimerase